MSKKKQTLFNPQNGHDVVDYVSGKNDVEIHQGRDGRVTIKTEKGSMKVFDNNKNYSNVDKANVRRWLKILGLLIFLGFCLWIAYVAQVRAALPA